MRRCGSGVYGIRDRRCCGDPGILSEPLRGGGNGGDGDTYLKKKMDFI